MALQGDPNNIVNMMDARAERRVFSPPTLGPQEKTDFLNLIRAGISDMKFPFSDNESLFEGIAKRLSVVGSPLGADMTAHDLLEKGDCKDILKAFFGQIKGPDYNGEQIGDLHKVIISGVLYAKLNSMPSISWAVLNNQITQVATEIKKCCDRDPTLIKLHHHHSDYINQDIDNAAKDLRETMHGLFSQFAGQRSVSRV